MQVNSEIQDKDIQRGVVPDDDTRRYAVTWPEWPAREWRALIALAASIGGSAVLTAMLAWIVHLLATWREAGAIATIAYGLLAIIGSILLSLGLAINRRSIKLTRDGFEATGGDGDGGGTATGLEKI